VEAFEKRGLGGQVSTKAAEGGVHAFSKGSVESLVRYSMLHEELPARLANRASFYKTEPSLGSILKHFDSPFIFEVPTLFVEMKQGGEVLNAYGMFEAATSKMGCYAGKPSPDNTKHMVELSLDLYLTVPAGNVNLAGYLAYIQAWRGITAFFMMGGGGEGTEQLGIYIGESAEEHLATVKGKPAELNEDGTIRVHAVADRKFGGTLTLTQGAFLTGRRFIRQSVRTVTPSTNQEIRGLIFPYFREMLESDPDTPFHIFWNLFSNCVSDTPEGLTEAATVYRRGFRYGL